ncbi:single-stranded DNA-binding protein [Nocardioides nematodiphilus]|uniref:single-stranded DNA-binding protein n=1 Tax=Nocardioides nematodiphilus TaxID=2849669 RepID=UPI001CD9923D|nr:single-stranded DNA-binding protein [Nocardioides nematodiphilus]MCA1984427.1 single-stranded DNA-binding protein [Nocardioides nematodiphilus]
MAGETIITVIGNLTDDPELRFTPSGAAVANFTVASTPRTLNRQTQQWEDGETLFLRCSIWRQAAENVAESLTRGTRVIVQGRLKARSYETREGEKRTVNELEVDEIGPSLTWATAKVNRVSRQGGQGGGGFGGGNAGGGQQGGFGGGGNAPQQQSAPANDPWATPAPQAPAQQGGAGGGYGGNAGGGAPANDPWGAPGVAGDEPPF